jgi:hypothetical protein
MAGTGEKLSGIAAGLRHRLLLMGYQLHEAQDFAATERALLTSTPALMLIDLDMPCGTPLVLADLAAWRHPEMGIFLLGAGSPRHGSGSLFADGAIFKHLPDVRGLLSKGMPVEDLAEVVAFNLLPMPPRAGRPEHRALAH